MTIGVGQTVLNGSNIPYDVDFDTEAFTLDASFNCNGQSYTFGPVGNTWEISNAEGVTCDLACGTWTGGQNDNTMQTIEFGISCLADVTAEITYSWTGDLNDPDDCPSGANGCGNDNLKFYYQLDGGGQVLIEDVATCNNDSGTSVSVPLNGDILEIFVEGGTQATDETIVIEEIILNGVVGTPPDNDDCGTDDVELTGSVTGEVNSGPGFTNDCATPDVGFTACSGDQDEANVWFTYTTPLGVSQVEFLLMDAGITDPAMQVFTSGCGGTSVGEECAGSSIIVDDCNSQTTFTIQVGSSTLNFGEFEIVVTETLAPTPNLSSCTAGADIIIDEMGNNNGADDCEVCVDDAFDLTALDPNDPEDGSWTYEWTDFGGGTYSDPTISIGAATIADHSGTWTLVVTDASGCSAESTFDMTVNGAPAVVLDDPGFPVCEGMDVNLSESGGDAESWMWTSDMTATFSPDNDENTVVSDLTDTEELIVTVTDAIGCTASDFIAVSLLPAPANNDCGNEITATVGVTSGTTDCANDDANLCSDNDHVVYFSFTTTEANATITIEGDNDTVVDAWTDCASGTQFDDTVTCAASVTISCVPAGTTLIIPVGSATGSEGDFDLTISESAGGVANDSCDDPAPATPSDVCVAENFSGITTDACPEPLGGPASCMQNDNPTIWFEFTADAATTSVTFSNVMGSFQVIGFACPPNTGISGCISDDTDVPVTPGEQYLISGTDDAGAGTVSFDLTMNAAPANDMCADAEDTSAGGGTASGTTGCATADGNFCAASGDHVVYYTYTIEGPGAVTLMIDLDAIDATDIAAEAWTDCGGTPYDASITCGTDLVLECVAEGTIITIPVGSADGGEGTFDITMTEIPSSGPANDLCGDATEITIDNPCEAVSASGTTVDACPETFSAECTQDIDPTVWFTFTTLPGTTSAEFTNVVGELQIMTDCPATTTLGDCITSDMGVTVDPSTQYWVTATVNGGEGDVSFDLALLEAPTNDNCTGPEDASSGAASGTTGCASADGNFCAASGDHVVYYTYTVAGPGAVTINIDVTAVDATDIAAEAWTDCAGTDFDDTIDCGTSLVLECVPAGTVLTITVGSADGGEGTFDLAIVEVPSSGPANDICEDATVITIDNPCEAVPASGTTVGACPESFTAGCTQDIDPTVWFTFTTLPGTTSAEFTNVVGELQIMTDCPATTTLGGCITSDMGVTVDPSTQYWVTATVNGGEGDVSFDLALLEAPANDNCTGPEDASSGAASGTTGCASADGNFCAASGDHVVYYTYTVAGPGAVTVNIDVTAVDATDIAAEAWTDCAGTDFDDTIDCGTSLVLECVPAGTVLTIPVGSADGGEGTFDLAIVEVPSSGPANDICEDAEEIVIDTPCEPVGVSGTTVGACPEIFTAGCTQDVDPTVWFTFTTLANTTSADISGVTGDLQIMSDCPATTTVSGCITGDMNILLDPATQYWVSATVNGGEGDVAFEISLLEAPDNDMCTAAEDASSGAVSGTTGCASEDTNFCGASGGHVVYYTYTVAGPGVVSIQIDVTAGDAGDIAIEAWEDCTGTDFDDTQTDCAASLMIPCVLEGTVITIPVGSADGMAGTFDLAISETAGTVANDDCTGAEVIVIDIPCEPVGVAGTTVDACPEAFTAGCSQDEDPTVWFTFTTLAGTTSAEFTNVVGEFQIITDCPATTSLGDCVTGDIGIDVDPSTTYWLTGTLPGGEGDISFDIALLEAPANDVCDNAFGAGATTVVGNNGCASADGNLCGGTDHVVYYTYTVAGPGSVTLEITVNELTASGISFAAFVGCGGVLMDESCDAAGTLEIPCVAEGTEVIIAIGTAEGNTGEFDITVGEVAGGSGPANDDCSMAEVVEGAECVPVTVAGSTTDACPEFVTGCTIDVDPTVWYEVNLPSGTTAVDFVDLTNGVNLALFDACNGTNLGCITGDQEGVMGLPETFYVAAVIPGGEGSFEFSIIAKIPPVNDLCADAIDGGGTGTTCCSTNDGIGCNQDNSVWYSYTPSNPDAAVIVMAEAGSITGMAVDVFTGDCGGLTPVQNAECVSSSSVEIPVSCADGATVFVQINSSSEDNCGTHTVSFSEETGCELGLTCDAASEQALLPVTNSGQDCLTSCNDYTCGTACGDNSVWFEVTTDGDASILNIQFEGDFNPQICVLEENCAGAQIYSGVGDVANVAVVANFTYYIAVGLASPADETGEFDLCVQTFLQLVDCATSAEIEPTRPEYPDSNPEGPYCPGETVNFCYAVDFNIDPAGDPDGNNCQWIQGIIPVVGCGWDQDLNAIADQPPGGWFWLDENEVNYNVTNPILSLSSECCGGLGLEYGGGGLSAGDGLPGGFWFTSPGGGANCTNDGNPNTMWGLPGGCGSTQSVEFCFDLTVTNVTDPSECDDPCNSDLKIHIFTFADGETGCWSSAVCAGDIPVTFDAFMDCSSLVTVELIDGLEEICSGESPGLLVQSNDGISTIIMETDGNPNITGNSFSGAFPDGEALITDILVNSGTDPEIITYEFFAQSPNPDSECNGPKIFVEVTVFPDIMIEFDEPYDVCWDGQEEIIPVVTGGSGVYDTYEWSTGASGATIMAPEVIGDTPGPYQYMLTVTDDLGCTGEATVEFIIRPQVVHMINGTSDFACIDGEDNLEEFCAVIQMGGANGPFTYNWSFDSDLIIDINDDCITIDEENSEPGFYEINLEVIDVYGCVYLEGPIFFSVENGPEINQDFPFCLSDGSGGVEYSFELCDDNGGSADWSLYDESLSVLLDGPYSGSCATFFVSPFGPGDEVPVTFIVEAIDLATGCIAYEEVTIDPPVVPEIPELIEGCSGEMVTIFLDNFTDFEDVTWCDGFSGGPSYDFILDEDGICFVTVFDLNGCELTYEIEIDVSDGAEVDISGSTAFCTGSSTTLCATSDPDYDYVWSNGETTECITVTTEGTYSVDVNVGNCTASASVDVTVGANLTPIINGGDLCAGGTVLLSTGNTFNDYVWTDAAQNVITPTATGEWEIEVSVGGVYTVEVSDGSCSGSATFTVGEQIPPTADITNVPQCNSDAFGDPTVLDLTTLVTNATGAVTILAPSGAPLVPPVVDFDGFAPGDVVYGVVVEGLDPCMDAMYNLTISVTDCGCPDVTLNNIGNFCNDAGTTLTLFNFLGQFADANGSFSVLDAAGNLGVVQPDGAGLLLIDPSFPAGIYTLVYTLDGPVPMGCPDSNMIQFEIFGIPQPILVPADPVCNSDAAGDDTTIDLATLITGAAGDWEDEDGNPLTTTIIDYNGADVGSETFFFNTTGATGSCNNFSVPVIINIIDCNCPVLGLDDLPTPMCQTDDAIDLNDFLFPGSEAGQWSATGPDPSFTLDGPSGFNPAGQPEGIYTFTYTLNSPGPITCTNEVVGTIELFEAIELPLLPSITACSSDATPTFPTFVDLTAIPELIGFSGDWSAPDDYNGGVIPDPSNVVFLDTIAGAFFFTFTTNNADAPCENVSVDVLINVSACDCPLIALAPSSLCNDNGSINLSTLIGFSAPGTFTYNSGPVGNVTLSGDTFDATDAEPGDYIFLYTLDTAVDNCPETGTLTITVFEPAVLDVGPDATVCSVTSTQGDTFFDFEAVQGAQIGSWEAPANYPDPITDFSNVSFLDLPPGSSYTFTLVGVAQGECDGTSDEITITVIDCDCPNISIDGAPELCNDGDDFLLTDLQNALIVDGSLSAENEAGDNIDIPGDVFDATDLDAGTYLVIFTPDVTPPSDCPQQDTVYITVVAPPSAGVFTDPATLCEEDGDVIDLADLLEGESAGGSWQETSSNTSTGGAFEDADGTFDTDGQTPGTYTFEYMFDTSNSPCDPVSETVVVEIEATPNADAGAGGTIDCDNNMVTLGGSGTSVGSEFTYTWLNPAGDIIYTGTTLEYVSMEGGDWTLVVENTLTGCSETSVATVLLDNDVPNFEFSSEDSPCFGDNAGSIEVNNIIGGSPPFEFQLNDGAFGTTQIWENLGPGNYTVTMLDALGCSAIRTTIIAEPGPITFEVGSDLIVEVGETVSLGFESSNVDPAMLETVIWTENGEVICEGSNIDETLDACLNIEVSPPLTPTEYCLEIITADGCVQIECRSLQALDVRDVYFPNVISGWNQEAEANTNFYVHSDEFVESIPSFAIYDRWGELIHSYEDGVPNDPEWGWDGTFNGSSAAQGVYVYIIELAYAGGETEIFTGTVTVTR